MARSGKLALLSLLVSSLACEAVRYSSRGNRPSDQADPNPGFEVSRVYAGGESASFENEYARVDVPGAAIGSASFQIKVRKTKASDADLVQELILSSQDQTCVEVAIVDTNGQWIRDGDIGEAISFTAKSDLTGFEDPVLATVFFNDDEASGVFFETDDLAGGELRILLNAAVSEIGFSVKAARIYFAVVERSQLGSSFGVFDPGNDVEVVTPIKRISTGSGTTSSGSSTTGSGDTGGSGSGSSGGTSSSELECPSGYILVPADPSSEVNTEEFCVMKYEAKNLGGVPLSQAAGLPWANIPRGSSASDPNGAWKKCRDLGAGYDLISNAQWQAIARNIETAKDSQDKLINWYDSGSPLNNNHYLNRGHSDGDPDSALEASTDDDPCFGTGDFFCAVDGHAAFSQKRTHILSNGAVIWDFGGNISEWVKDDSTHRYYQSDALWSTVLENPGNGTPCLASSGCNGPQGSAKSVFGPKEEYGLGVCGLGSEYCGFGKAYLYGDAGAIGRGGNWKNLLDGGIFQVYTHFSPTSTNMNTHAGGFRCVFTGDSE